MTKDALGDRIKENYENRTRYFLPRRTYTIIRTDGKAFHSLTKGFNKPFDRYFMGCMGSTAMFMCENIQGVRFAYTQSDEISLLLTDFDKTNSCAWFDANLQKMVSVAASTATVGFNQCFAEKDKWGMFDARVFTISDPNEVFNYFVWRQVDATRNSIQMAARAIYSHKELNGKNTAQLQDMLMAKGVNWNDYSSGEKRGRLIVKSPYLATSKDKEGNDVKTLRNQWVSLNGYTKDSETPVFTQNRLFLNNLIPAIEGLVPANHNGGASIYDAG